MDKLVPHCLYPKDVLPFPADRLAGTAFFPGGSGLYLEGRDLKKVCFPAEGVMMLGHNYDSERGFREASDNHGDILNRGAWRRLLRLLTKANISLSDCFFTNAFMGMCAGDDNTKYRGRDDTNFRAACLSFLKMQIEIQRPRFIITLGMHAP